MNTQISNPPRPMPEIMHLEISDLRRSLSAGWQDFKNAPLYGLFFSAIYVVAGWLMFGALTSQGKVWWAVVGGCGFPILGPFIACGFYEISRRRERGEPLTWSGVLGAVFRQGNGQIPTMAAIVVVFFLFWNFIAHVIFALFLGRMSLVNISSSLEVLTSPQGLMMLAFGTLVGAALAGVLFALSVVSLPLLMDRDTDFITAMIASWTLVTHNLRVMGVWALVIAAGLFAGMLPGFLGLFVTLPLLGHASWHLYRLALD